MDVISCALTRPIRQIKVADPPLPVIILERSEHDYCLRIVTQLAG